MNYFAGIDDDPESSTYGQAQSLHRMDVTDKMIIVERWNGKDWVDNPALILATGIGGNEDYQAVSEKEAGRLQKKLPRR